MPPQRNAATDGGALIALKMPAGVTFGEDDGPRIKA